jgi:hypothetical protein
MQRPLLCATFCFVIVFGAFLVNYGTPGIRGDEGHYTLLAYKQWHPSFLADDFTLSAPWWSHANFSRVAGLLGVALSLEQMFWVGRVIFWSLAIVAVLRFGKHFDLPVWLRGLALILWVTTANPDTMPFRYFGAGPLAGVVLLFALDSLLRQQSIRALALIGLCFSIHPTTGLWTGSAAFVAWLRQRPPTQVVLKAVLVGGLCAVPGVATLWLSAQATVNLDEVAEFLVSTRYPDLDPFQQSLRDVVTWVLMLAFLRLSFPRDSRDPRLVFLTTFLASYLAWFGLNYLFRALDLYSLVATMPGRGFAPLALMFVLFRLVRLTAEPAELPSTLKARVLLGLFAFCIVAWLDSPLSATVDRMREVARQWTSPAGDLRQSLQWLAEHTPQDAAVLSPPWVSDSWYQHRRAMIVSGVTVAFEHFPEWRERMESVVGQAYLEKDQASRTSAMERAYDALDETAIQSLTKRYGASYVVARRDYSFPVVHRQGNWKVYKLPLQETDNAGRP